MAKTGFISFPQPPDGAAIELRRDVLLVTQAALLGEISALIRAITVSWSDNDICLKAIIHGEPLDTDIESMECVGTKIVASFPEHKISVEIIRVDAPDALEPHRLMAWVYMRKEK